MIDELLDERMDGSFVVEVLEDIPLLEAGTALPLTQSHSLVNSLAVYFANGEVVLRLA